MSFRSTSRPTAWLFHTAIEPARLRSSVRLYRKRLLQALGQLACGSMPRPKKVSSTGTRPPPELVVTLQLKPTSHHLVCPDTSARPTAPAKMSALTPATRPLSTTHINLLYRHWHITLNDLLAHREDLVQAVEYAVRLVLLVGVVLL